MRTLDSENEVYKLQLVLVYCLKMKMNKWVSQVGFTLLCCTSPAFPAEARERNPRKLGRRVCRAQALYRRGRRERAREGERKRERERERELWQRSSPTEQPGRVASEQSLSFADGVYSLSAAFSFDLFQPHPLPLPVLPSQSTMVSIISDLDPLKSWNVLR